MPNYSLIANTQFRNRSFDDMLKPLLMYTQEYNAIEDAASDLATQASVWEGMANEQTDPEAYAQYKRYADDLQRQAVNLSQNGLNPTTRRELLNLKRRYSSEITPIEQAYANRKAQADEQRKALLQNPTLLLSRRADMTSLDDYMRNPQLGYDSYSGALLTKQVGDAASAIAKELRNYGNGKPLDGFTKTWLQQHGFTAAEVAQAINNPDSPRSSHILNTLVNNVIADSGVPQWADRATLGQAYNYARQGLWNAVGQAQIQTYTDEAAKLAAQEASQKRVAQYSAGLQEQQRVNRPQIIPRALRSQQQIDEKNKEMQKFISAGFVIKQGNKYILTKKGKDEYFKAPTANPDKRLAELGNAEYTGPFGSKVKKTIEDMPNTVYSPFRQFMDALNGGKAIKVPQGQSWTAKMGDLFTKAVDYYKEDSYDMYHSTEYIRQLDDSYAKELKRQVMSEPEVLKSLDFKGKEGFGEKAIDKVSLEKFAPTRVNYSKYGTTITWINDKRESVRTNAPKAVNEAVTSEVMRAFDTESIYNQILHVGRMPKTKWDYGKNKEVIDVKDGIVQFTAIPLTQQQIGAYTNNWYNVIDAIQGIGGMYVAPSTTETRKYGSYDYSSAGMKYLDSIDDIDE